MFDIELVKSDKFLDMPQSSQALYFHLGMDTDDEGFVSNPKSIMRILGVTDDSMKILIAKGLVINFNSGVIVVTDFHQNNYLDSSRSRPTKHQDEKKQLILTNEKKYVLNNCLTDVKTVERSGGELNLEKNAEQVSVSPKEKPINQENKNTQEVIDYFYKRVAEVYGFKPEITGGRDFQLARRILKKYSLVDVKSIIDDFLDRSDHTGAGKAGSSLSFALSSVSINKWLQDHKALV